jgi:hypothetical protein
MEGHMRPEQRWRNHNDSETRARKARRAARIMSLVLLAALALPFAAPSAPAEAGVNTWTPSGPEGGIITALAIDPQSPDTLYAGIEEHGVYKSTNGGASWAVVNTGLTDMRILSLAAAPSTPVTLYAGTYFGVFKSIDGGASWSESNVGLTDTTVTALAVDKTTPATLYAGTGSGVFKSTNSGANWNASSKHIGFQRAIRRDV